MVGVLLTRLVFSSPILVGNRDFYTFRVSIFIRKVNQWMHGNLAIWKLCLSSKESCLRFFNTCRLNLTPSCMYFTRIYVNLGTFYIPQTLSSQKFRLTSCCVNYILLLRSNLLSIFLSHRKNCVEFGKVHLILMLQRI